MVNQRYVIKKVNPNLALDQMPFWYRLSYNKFYVDEIYDRVIVQPLEWMGDFLTHNIEKNVIDGAVNEAGSTVLWLSTQLRKMQTGNIGFYVLAMVIGMVLILFFGLGKMNLF